MKDIGDLGELKFIVAAHEKGFTVSKPFGDNTPYDFIVDFNGKLSRVQCKSTATKDTRVRRDRFKINTTYGRHRQAMYSSESIDFFACFIIPFDSWYIIPVSDIYTKSIVLYPHKGVRTARYEQFLEAWELLREADTTQATSWEVPQKLSS